jgi:hypothetical protein
MFYGKVFIKEDFNMDVRQAFGSIDEYCKEVEKLYSTGYEEGYKRGYKDAAWNVVNAFKEEGMTFDKSIMDEIMEGIT